MFRFIYFAFLFLFATLFGGVAMAQDPFLTPVAKDPALNSRFCWLSPPPDWSESNLRLTIRNPLNKRVKIEVDGRELTVMAPVPGEDRFARQEVLVQAGDAWKTVSYLDAGNGISDPSVCYTTLPRTPTPQEGVVAPVAVTFTVLDVVSGGPTVFTGRALVNRGAHVEGEEMTNHVRALSRHPIGTRVSSL